MKKDKMTRVMRERELGYSYYWCESCKKDLTKIVKKNLERIILAKLEDKNGPRLYCPRCEKRLDFSQFSVNIQINIQARTYRETGL